MEDKFTKVIEALDAKLATIRAGRANPGMLSGIMVNYYGTPTPIQSIANITVPEAKQLFIKPFDRSALKEVEKAINEANLGIAPTNNGEIIILTIPALNEERRKEYVKQAKDTAEDARIALRNVRQDENNNVKHLELSEDEEKRELEKIQDLVNKYNKVIDEKLKEKENELMQV